MDSFIFYALIKGCGGSVASCQALGFTQVTQEFFDKYTDLTGSSMLMIYIMVGAGVLSFILATAHAGLFAHVAANVNKRLRKLFFKSVIRQDMTFFDCVSSPGEISVRLSSELTTMKNGMNDKVSVALQFLSQAIVGVLIGFIYSWELTLCILGTFPVIVSITYIGIEAATEVTSGELKAYGKAGDIV